MSVLNVCSSSCGRGIIGCCCCCCWVVDVVGDEEGEDSVVAGVYVIVCDLDVYGDIFLLVVWRILWNLTNHGLCSKEM